MEDVRASREKCQVLVSKARASLETLQKAADAADFEEKQAMAVKAKEIGPRFQDAVRELNDVYEKCAAAKGDKVSMDQVRYKTVCESWQLK